MTSVAFAAPVWAASDEIAGIEAHLTRLSAANGSPGAGEPIEGRQWGSDDA